MGEIVRFYEIAPSNTTIIRAWQGHREEKKWFYCHTGSFVINLIQLDDFDTPSDTIVPEKFVLKADGLTILEISGGYANGFKALEEGSKMMVFSNFGLDRSKNDELRYPIEKWSFRS